jgi:hypothetical protein
MKYWFKTVLMFALITVIGFAPQLRATPGCSCTLVWNPSPSDGIAGYAVYYGVSGSSVTNRFDAGPELSATITGLAPATTYFFYVVVYDSWGDESPPSNILLFTTPPISPVQLSRSNSVVNIQFQVTPEATCSVEYTPTLNPPSWTLWTSAVADTNGLVSVYDTIDPTQPARFYRAVIPSQQPPQLSVQSGVATRLQWDATAGTAGYTVYYGAVGSSVTNQISVGTALSATINGLNPSTPYFFYVVSHDSIGDQSPPSNLVLFTTPPMSPLQISKSGSTINIQFRATPGTACSVEFTPSLNSPTWTILATSVADQNGLVSIDDTVDLSQPGRFYRGVIIGQVPPQLSATPDGLTTSLHWNSSDSPSTIGWAVYYGVVGSSVTNRVEVGWGISTTIQGLSPSTPYYFYVVAYDLFGNESAPSNVILYTTPSPISPLQISQLDSSTVAIQFTVPPLTACHVEYTTRLNPPTWTLLAPAIGDVNGHVTVTDTIDGTSGQRFYRGAIP